MTKSESKYFNTAHIMDEALIELLEKKDIQYISVKEICEKAGVNRSTFYLHYEGIGDLLDETIAYIQEEFNKSFTVDSKDFIDSINEMPLQELVLINQRFLMPYLSFIKEHKTVYQASYSNPKALKAEMRMTELYKLVLKPIFTRFGIPENSHKYWLAYHIEGVSAIVREWLKSDCNDSIEEVIHIIEDCVRTGNGMSGKRYGE